MVKEELILDIDKDHMFKICDETLNWCIKKFGTPKDAVTPKIKVSYDRRFKKQFGNYYNGLITIFPNICKNQKNLLRTILHEFRHYQQMPEEKNMEIYHTMSKNFEYKEHPLEVDSEVFEKKYYRSCKSHLKKLGLL
jgi:hypothetical protein